MLSYRLRHLCSIVIASLSTIGLFSVGQRAVAAAPGGGSLTCETTTSGGASVNATVVAQDSSCVYTCNPDYFYVDSSGMMSKGFVVFGSGLVVPSGGCVAVKPTCEILSSHTGIASVEVVEADSSSDPTGLVEFYCKWKCKTGYSKEGGDDATASFESSRMSMPNQSSQSYQDCKPRRFKVTFDCVSGNVVGTNSSTVTGYAYYNQVFEIEHYCSPYSGMTFNGWSGYIGELI